MKLYYTDDPAVTEWGKYPHLTGLQGLGFELVEASWASVSCQKNEIAAAPPSPPELSL